MMEYEAAVSLDIKNAFNSISWKRILQEIELKQVPNYLRKIIRSYLSQRTLVFEGQCRILSSDDPQGLVLHPLLWNIAFDGALRVKLPPGCITICYADDTLVLTRAAIPIDLEWCTNRALRLVADSVEKSEVMTFTPKYKMPDWRLYCEGK